jgi:hypothetical protein
MCGASLDSAEVGDKGDDKKQARVRQRTMSAPEKNVSSVVEKLRAEFSPKPYNGSSESKESAEDQSQQPARVALDQKNSAADPLQAFLQEVEEETHQEQVFDQQPDESNSDGMYDFDADLEDSWQSTEDQGEQVPDWQGQEEEKTSSVYQSRESFDNPSGEAARANPEARRPSQSQDNPRVIVESGRPRKSKGLSFSRKDVKESFRKDNRESRPFVRKDNAKAETRKEQSSGLADRHRADEERAKQIEKPVPHKELPPRQPVKAQRGRLAGWLVSYEQPDGEAIELREGKFFVTSSSLKQTDLILDDSSISTPHAMVRVGAEGKLWVQDLMSERGVFVRSGRRDNYRRQEEPFEVENGDWLRFGDVEFLVSLIAHVGEK